MTTQDDIDRLNEKIGYDAGRIFWSGTTDACWTSDLWIDLCRQGWRSSTRAGFCVAYDEKGNEAARGVGRANMLAQVAFLLR